MLVALNDADPHTCGGKAGSLGALRRAGVPVPDGVVLTFDAYRAAVRDLPPRAAVRLGTPGTALEALATAPLPATVRDSLTDALRPLADEPVAVRSSASTEDTAHASAAGQHESVIGVRGVTDILDAVRTCWASLHSARAVAYRSGSTGHRPEPAMAVLVQRLVDADAAGVMFTPAHTADATLIEASWGLGIGVVEGTVIPDSYRVGADGSITSTTAVKQTRVDRYGGRLRTSDVRSSERSRPALDDTAASRLADLGRQIAQLLGGPQDVEWALADGRIWILQARPITARPPSPPPSGPPTDRNRGRHSHRSSVGSDAMTSGPPTDRNRGRHSHRASVGSDAMTSGRVGGEAGSPVLIGTPGSRGVATGPARVVHGPGDFARVRAGDVLVCRTTDPAWTPLLGIVAAVVTETGGVLSHAAIVARERGIPAVLGVTDATTRIPEGTVVEVDGDAGTLAPSRA